MPNTVKTILLASAAILALATSSPAAEFDIPGGDLKAALDSYARQTGVSLLYSDQAIRGARSRGMQGSASADDALSRILSGSGFQVRRHQGSAVTIVRDEQSALDTSMQFAQGAPPRASVETVTVTSSKLGGGDVQSVPIAITALSQEQLTATQTAGGPDLVKQVPNLTFTKTNFTGYSIQIRGIGTQAISVTTDPAVAVAFNDMPFIRNHFFEQEFFDVAQVAILRGPQGTLYGRNATAGVVNLTSAKPTDQFEAMASAELGNYSQRRFEGMLNLPIVDDRVALRLAGEWTKRDGYSFNGITGRQIDGRNLWSGRATLSFKPNERLQAYLVWEHFQEDDDRMRSAKQLCKTDVGPGAINGEPVAAGGNLSQGCLPASLYSPESYGVPNGYSLPYYIGPSGMALTNEGVNPYAHARQSPDLRVIETMIDPQYKAKSNILQFNVDYKLSPALTFTSQSGFNQDFLWAIEDYNRFESSKNLFLPTAGRGGGDNVRYASLIDDNGVFCDPQLGCSGGLVAADLSTARSWQANQEFRLTSHFDGPLNFSAGGNYMHYETVENYNVFINALTLLAANPGFGGALSLPVWAPGVSDNHECLAIGHSGGFSYLDPSHGSAELQCGYIDPNPISSLNNKGHNYFLSQNPYVVNSYAVFGEANYDVSDELKLVGGLRWTQDRKHFSLIPSWVVAQGYGYPVSGVVDQQWSKFSGRAVVNWTPKLSFTDQTLIYGSYARGYKAGGANPPGAVILRVAEAQPIHPLTFAPEYVNAFELGTKNTLLDGALTFNSNVFFYDYKGYQISEIVDRTSINLNFDAQVKGAEIEAVWEPVAGLRFNFAGGYENTRLAKGSKAVDLMDRTAGNPDWVVIKPGVTEASNCIIPKYLADITGGGVWGQSINGDSICGLAYTNKLDPVTRLPYHKDPVDSNWGAIPLGYPGFNPNSVDPTAPSDVNNGLGLPPNNGAGFDKNLGGNRLPNAPPFTIAAGAQYSMPLTSDWAGTFRADYYWQDYSWARVFNSDPYDRLRGYTNVNLALIFTSQTGWQVMLYDKNVFNTTAITGAFLNSDDTGLTTNVFVTDPRLIGVRVTKNW